MKSTNHFKNTIQAYLEERVASDTLFEWSYTNPNKNIDDCITYILNTVQKSGCMGFTDDEIFGLAIHYYTEADIEIGKSTSCNVVVNHVVELSAEEKKQARKDAMQRAENEAYSKMMKSKPKTKKIALNPQPSLFDF